MQYNLSAIEILSFFGYDKSMTANKLDDFADKNSIVLPKEYRNFMETAYNCPLLKTADIWTDVDDLSMYYDTLIDRIADYAEEWEEDPEFYKEDELYQLSQLPQEQWKSKVLNFLEIGSDYGAGIVTFGISPNNMNENDPPLFWQHEADPCTMWKPDLYGRRISDFLLDVVLNALNLTSYETAERSLKSEGWEYTDLTAKESFENCMKKANIDFEQIKRYGNSDDGASKLFCCCDRENNIFYTGKISVNGKNIPSVLYQISKIGR